MQEEDTEGKMPLRTGYNNESLLVLDDNFLHGIDAYIEGSDIQELKEWLEENTDSIDIQFGKKMQTILHR